MQHTTSKKKLTSIKLSRLLQHLSIISVRREYSNAKGSATNLLDLKRDVDPRTALLVMKLKISETNSGWTRITIHYWQVVQASQQWAQITTRQDKPRKIRNLFIAALRRIIHRMQRKKSKFQVLQQSNSSRISWYLWDLIRPGLTSLRGTNWALTVI